MSKHSPGPWSWGAGAGKWVLCDGNDKRMISFSAWSIEPMDMTLIKKAPELLAMLRRLEWRGSPAGNECPECEHLCERTVNVPGPPVPGMLGMVIYTGETKIIPGGHAPDCRLKLLLAEVDG